MEYTDLVAFEREYVERAQAVVGARSVASISAAFAPPDSGGLALGGWWCRPEGAATLLVLPNPWADRHAVTLMERRCWLAVGRLVERLAPALNDLHGVTRHVAYWDLLLSPWLLHLVSGVADRSFFLRVAATLAPDARLDRTTEVGVPATMSEAVAAIRGPEGNQALLGRLARELAIPLVGRTEQPQLPDWSPPSRAARVLRSPRQGATLVRDYALGVAARRALESARPATVTIVGQSALSAREILVLGRAVRGLRVKPASPFAATRSPVSADMRRRLPAPREEDEPLERLVLAILPDVTPRSLVEDYETTCRASALHYGAATPVVACNYAADEVQNEFLARCAESGRGMAFAQHGGFYRQGAVNAQERLELRPGTEFWGWGTSDRHAIYVPSPRIERLRDTHRGGRLVTLVEATHPADTYVVRFSSTPLGNQALELSTDLARFVAAVDEPLRSAMRLKRFPEVLAPAPRPAALEALRTDGPPGAATASDWLRRSRLAVVAYPDTPFLEALVIGVPTVGVWNTTRWTWTEDVARLMARLEAAQIVFGDPAGAAQHVARVFGDVDSWWRDPAVVEARRAFVDRVVARGDWRAAWISGLRRLAAASPGERRP